MAILVDEEEAREQTLPATVDTVDDLPDEPVPAGGSRTRAYRWLAKNRRPFFVVHKWLSIVLLLWVLMECVTGSILVFRPEIERFWHRADFQVTDGEQIGV